MKYRVTASSLNLRSGPSTSATSLKTIPMGATVEAVDTSEWMLVIANGATGWMNRKYLEELEESPVKPYVPPVPNGPNEVRRVFGEPGSKACQAGRIRLPAPLKLSWSPREMVQTFACHELVVVPMQAAFDEVYREALWEDLRDYGGCYEFRKIRGSSESVSLHSWGIAVDLDVARNPLGATPKINPRIVAIFKKHGFVWGGDFKRRDGMHFQWATGV